MARRISITIEGSPQDNGRVRLFDFIKQLEAIKTSLKQTERLVSDSDDPGLYYKIVELTYSSPATVVIEPVESTDDIKGLGDRTVRQFVTNLRQVARGRRPTRADLPALQSYQGLTAMLRQHVGAVAIKHSGNQTITIDKKFATRIARIIGPDETAKGSLYGMLEWLNLHRNINRFHIYPTIGPTKVDCDFQPELKPKVIKAIDQYVRVTGDLRYKHLEKFPYAMDVANIEIMPPENELPTLFDLKGIAPQATGDMSAADFIRSLRD